MEGSLSQRKNNDIFGIVCFFFIVLCVCGVSREALTAVIETRRQNSTVVLVGSSAGGIGAMNVASWLLDSFEQVRHREIQRGNVELCFFENILPFSNAQPFLKPAT